MMNTFKTITKWTLSLVLVSFFYQANAQAFKVETVKMLLMDNSVDDSEKDLQKALELINEASSHSSSPGDPKFHYYRGLLHLKIANRRLDDPLWQEVKDPIQVAYESFNKVMEVDKKNKFTKDAKLNMLNVAVGMYNKGQNAYIVEDYVTAIQAFQLTKDLMQYDTEKLLEKSNLTSQVVTSMIAYCHMATKNNKMAISNFKDLINSGYNDENVFINLAILQLEEKDTLGALETIDKGKQIFETNKNLINLELDLYLKLGRSEELITKLNQAVDQDPYNPIYYFARAVTYEGMKKFDLAEQDYNKAIEANSGYYDAYYNLGVMYTNRAAEIIEEMNSKDNLKMADYDAYKSKYEALYKKSLAFFETVFNENVDMKKADKLELADVMKKLYAQISDMDNFNAMKKFIEENK